MKTLKIYFAKISYIAMIQFVTIQFGGVFAQGDENTLPESGNIGIGTTSPSTKLHVIGNVLFDSESFSMINIKKNENQIDPDTNYYFLQLKSDGTIEARKGPFGNMPALEPGGTGTYCDKYYFSGTGTYTIPNPQWNNGTNKIYTACTAIKVGIGNTSPRVNLDVSGTTFSRKMYIGEADPLLGNSFVSPDFHLKSNNTGGNANATTFLVENRDRRLFQIQNDGLVRAREIKVDLANNWPDYVFQSTYSLMPLNDVKTFIGKNGHLPNVPSACEIEKDGIPLGEMNRVLLEKVEEMTLYMIQMQEEQERLKSEIEELKTKTVEK